MTPRQIVLCLSLWLAALAPPAQAFEIGAMTDDERTAFRAEIRAYLLDNPDVLVEAINELDARKQAEQVAADQDLVSQNQPAIFADGRSWVGGNPDGDVMLVEFVDYRCAYCKRAHAEVTDLVKTDGNIRFVLKEFPILGDESLLASHFAIAVRGIAGPEVYWQMHDALMNFRGDITPEALDRLAEQLGLDPAAVRSAMDDPAVAAEIAGNHALAEKLQIGGTPTFVVQAATGTGSQTMLRGYMPQDQMQAIVADMRTKG